MQHNVFEVIAQALDISNRLEENGWIFGGESELSRTWRKGRWVCKVASIDGSVWFFRF